MTKTSLASVSPGESFQTFLGIDPAVKVRRQQAQYYTIVVIFVCVGWVFAVRTG